MLLSTRSTNLLFQRPFSILSPYLSLKLHDSAPAPSKVLIHKDEGCCDFLPWLEEKAGAEISSTLSIGKSCHGRCLLASKFIQTGDCMLKVPFSVQLSPDNIPQEIKPLLGDGIGDVAKLAIVTLLELKRGQDSEWFPYISCLPLPGEMHSTIFWSPGELEMIRPSSLYETTIQQQVQIQKEFFAIKAVLDLFPEIFGDVKLEDFKHAYGVDFFNHDGNSESVVLSDEAKKISEVVADRNYVPGEEVLIRYGKFSNSSLLIDFGFSLPYNSYDQVHFQIDIPFNDDLRAMKLEILHRHSLPAMKDVCLNPLGASFSLKEVRSARGRGKGIPQSFRAFGRVMSCKSPQELEDLATEAAQNDGRLARLPFINRSREIEAHEMLLAHIDELIEQYNLSIEQMCTSNYGCNSDVFLRRRRMAQDLLAGEVRVLRSASAWLKNYCAR